MFLNFLKQLLLKYLAKPKKRKAKNKSSFLHNVSIFYVYYRNLISIWHKDDPDLKRF